MACSCWADFPTGGDGVNRKARKVVRINVRMRLNEPWHTYRYCPGAQVVGGRSADDAVAPKNEFCTEYSLIEILRSHVHIQMKWHLH